MATVPASQPHPHHVAIIMDGNGRWAARRGLPREAGHRAGADAVERTVTAARELGLRVLTLYAFSADNWQRPAGEVRHLMTLLRRFLERERLRCVKQGIRVSVIGRRDRLSDDVRQAIDCAERDTADGAHVHLRIAVDYSSRHSIVEAARLVGAGAGDAARFALALGRVNGQHQPAPDVDLLVRTSGEHRLSDFLLWECAYAELVFTDRLWPDFDGAALAEALAEYARRDRRFGGLGEGASLTASVG
jgi:undecaprenyl diphosphate synthase